MQVIDRFSYPHLVAMRDGASGYARVGAALRRDSTALRLGDREFAIRQAFATADYLPLLVDRPARGRFYTADEDDVNSPAAVAVISYALWQRAFGGDPAAVGRAISVGEDRLTIVARRGYSAQ